jgi:hypothetical protein
VVSKGYNKCTGVNNPKPSIHAELDAMKKLKPFVKGKLQKVDILVIRYVKTKSCGHKLASSKQYDHKLASSKPCFHCLHMLKSYAETKGYKICNIYYSNDGGGIVKEKMSKISTNHRSYAMRIKNY